MNDPENPPAELEQGDPTEPEAGSGAAAVDEHSPDSLPGQGDQGDEFQPVEAQRFDAQPFEAQPLEAQSYEAQQFETQQFETQQFGGQTLDGQPVDGQTLDGQTLDGQPYPDQYYPAQQYQPGFDPASGYTHDDASQQYAQQQYAEQQYAEQQYAEQQFAEQQYSQNPQHYPQQFAGGIVPPAPGSPTAPDSPGERASVGPAVSTPARTRRPRVDENGVAYGVGRLSVREVVVVILAGLVFVVSFLPLIGGVYADLFGYASLWAPAPWLAIPGALLLASAATLLVVRRLRPDLALRIGSLSVDQFASVAAVSTAGFFVGALLLLLGVSAWFGSASFGGAALSGSFDVFQPGPGLILGLIFSLAALVPTVGARLVPLFAQDFTARTETPAHPVARNAVAVPVRPRQPRAPRPQAVPHPEVHQYGDEHSGSIQLTPADTRPADVGAYRRRGWSPDSVADSPLPESTLDRDQASDRQFRALGFHMATNEVGTDDADIAASGSGETGGLENDATEPDPAETIAMRASGTGSAIDPNEEIDELHSGEEPAPVSALRHVAEQETLADAAPSETALTATLAGESSAERSETATGADAIDTPAVVSTQPFWVYSRVPLPVVDEKTGVPVFEIGPGAWALAIVDRGTELVIRHDDGRIGVLRSLSGVMRG